MLPGPHFDCSIGHKEDKRSTRTAIRELSDMQATSGDVCGLAGLTSSQHDTQSADTYHRLARSV